MLRYQSIASGIRRTQTTTTSASSSYGGLHSASVHLASRLCRCGLGKRVRRGGTVCSVRRTRTSIGSCACNATAGNSTSTGEYMMTMYRGSNTPYSALA